MKTAVEWLVDKIAEDYPEIPKSYREECQKAKEMEKEQRIKAYQLGYDTGYKVCEMKFNGLFKSE
jgi:hypothetical protein